MNETILDTKNLNNLIKFWRKKREVADAEGNQSEVIVAACYIDAFQTVRINNGLPLLPVDNE